MRNRTKVSRDDTTGKISITLETDPLEEEAAAAIERLRTGRNLTQRDRDVLLAICARQVLAGDVP